MYNPDYFIVWCAEHGDTFDHDPLHFTGFGSVTTGQIGDPDELETRVEVCFDVTQCSLRESGALVSEMVRLMDETFEAIDGMWVEKVELLDLNYVPSDMPQLTFTVVIVLKPLQ